MNIVEEVKTKVRAYDTEDKDMRYFMYQLFLECEHGDEEHKVWLYNKFINFIDKYSIEERV